MRRFFSFLLALSLTILPVKSAETPCYVALTFDDGPSGRYTRQLLDGLYDRGIHATFALCGYRMKDYPDIVQRMVSEGHELVCHGYSHKNLQDMSRRQIAQEITSTEELLPQGCGFTFLRPPGGCINDSIRQVAAARKLPILCWTVDPRDWENHNAASVEKMVLKNVKDGDIILLHDMTTSSVKAALDIIDVLLEKNYKIVTVSELAKIRQTKLLPGKVYKSFPPEQKSTP